jgi:hypothetical protein
MAIPTSAAPDIQKNEAKEITEGFVQSPLPDPDGRVQSGHEQTGGDAQRSGDDEGGLR